jgi:hypothetical protein
MAEEVKDKTRANFCEWFQAKAHAYTPADAQGGTPRSALEALFGESGTNDEKPSKKLDLDRLFGD